MNSSTKQARRSAGAETPRQVLDYRSGQNRPEALETLRPGAFVSSTLYAEVKRRVLHGLMDAEWPQGAPIPTETQLAQRYGVSVGTVRKALGELVAERVLVRRPGLGTFPARHDRDSMLETFFNIVNSRGEKEFPASELLSFRRTAADMNVARHLRLEQGAPVIAFDNLLRLEGHAVIHDGIAVPQAIFPALDETLLRQRNMTIFALYQTRCGVTVTRLEEWIRAAAVPPAAARYLGLSKSAPVLAIERVAHTYDGTPVEYRQRYINTAHHAYLNVLGMNRPRR
jgi:GntR family transcriptional regulator